MEEIQFDDESIGGKLIRSLGPFGFIAVDIDRVNLDDLLDEPRLGKIVRCFGDPNKVISCFAAPNCETLGCLAGWISDAD